MIFVGYRALFVYDFSLGACPSPKPGGIEAASAGGDVAFAGGGPSAPVEITVLSYNIGGHTALVRGGHVAAVAALIARERPDVVALQEVHRLTWQSRFRDQAAQIAADTGLALQYGPSFRALGGEFGNAVLVRGRVLRGEVVSLPSFGEPRSLLRTTAEVRGLELDVYATHLTAWGGLNRRTRALQASCLAEQVHRSGRPFVFCGDLNAEPSAADLEAVTANARMRLCGAPDEPTHALLGRRLDYIFSDPRFELLESRVLREGPSDHWPVLARLRWPGRG